MIYLGGLAMPTHYLHNLRFGHTLYTICTHSQHVQDLAGKAWGASRALLCPFAFLPSLIIILFRNPGRFLIGNSAQGKVAIASGGRL